ncbi:MAG TPA: aminotransferase class I/II-fold pyridoxal phosphate-dependent enzyme, partial [Polyangia bacterium]
MKLARRLSVVEPSPTLAVSAKAAKLKAEGIDVVSFGAGEPDFDTPVHIKEAAKKALDAGATKYTLVEGTVPLRKAVAKWIGDAHGFAVETNQVIVSSGAKQSIFNAVFALIDEGDEVIIPTPAWVSYNDIVKLAGGRPVNVPTKAEENFQVRVEDVAKAITPRTKMILVCSPSNPTGAIYDEATLTGLARLAVEKNVWLMTDDIYRTLVYGDGKFFQPATLGADVRSHMIIIDGVSKAF